MVVLGRVLTEETKVKNYKLIFFISLKLSWLFEIVIYIYIYIYNIKCMKKMLKAFVQNTKPKKN